MESQKKKLVLMNLNLLYLAWMQVTSFVTVCWQVSPLSGVLLAMEGIEVELGVRQNLPSAQWLSPPYSG